MRENTNIGEGKLYTNANPNKHFKNDISTTSASTDFDITYAKTVNKLLPKGPKSKVQQHPVETTKCTKEAARMPNETLKECKICGKQFLRPGNINRHENSGACNINNNNEKRVVISRTSNYSTCDTKNPAIINSVSKIHQQAGKKKSAECTFEIHEEWTTSLKGSAQRRATKRKAVRFTNEQKEIMERCFDSGITSKSARYTPLQCQKEMTKQIGPDLTLKENQIRSHFSRRHAKHAVKEE